MPELQTPDDLAAIRARAAEALPAVIREEKTNVWIDRNRLLAHIDALTARLAALEAAGDALDAALGVYVSTPKDRKLLAWRPVAGRRAAWRAAREG